MALFSMLIIIMIIDALKETTIRFFYPIVCGYSSNKTAKETEWNARLQIGERENANHLKRDKILCQVQVNDVMMESENNVDEELMNLTMQFGYVCLFSNIFPLAGFFAWFTNIGTILCIYQEFELARRTMP